MRALLIVVAVAVSTSSMTGQTPPRPRPQAPARKAPEPALTPVGVETDLACTLTLNGENQGELPANGSKTFELPIGEHVLRASSKADPSVVWRKVVEITGPQRRAVLVELAPLLEQKRAVEAEKARAEQQAREDAARRAAEAEQARQEQIRIADEAVKAKAAEAQRALDAERARVEAERLQAEHEKALDAARARADEVKRLATAVMVNGAKQPVAFKVEAALEAGHPLLRITGPDGTTRVALVDREGKPAFRFEVQHVHGRECTGFLDVTPTRVAFAPMAPQCGDEAFDVARATVQKLKTDPGMPRVDFEAAGRGHRFGFPTENAPGPTAVAAREWFKSVMLDFAAAQKLFERETGDLKLPAKR
jgi:hypothetical protein